MGVEAGARKEPEEDVRDRSLALDRRRGCRRRRGCGWRVGCPHRVWYCHRAPGALMAKSTVKYKLQVARSRFSLGSRAPVMLVVGKRRPNECDQSEPIPINPDSNTS